MGAMLQLFADKLSYLRQQRGMTKTELAEMLSLASHAHIANLEAGRDTPSLSLVINIALLFAVSTDYLLRNDLPVDYQEGEKTAMRYKSEDLSTFGAKIRSLRKQLGMRQVHLAQQLGVSHSYLSNVEAGRRGPSLDLVANVADIFQVTTDHLLFE